MTDTCVFCKTTGTDFKPEHWVSQWISRAVIGKSQGIQHHVPGRDPWVSRIVDLTVPHVCPECNHGWMSDIETRSRNTVLPLIKGKDSTLNRSQQQILATWCFLKILTVELGRPADEAATYPPAIYEGFRVHKRPPGGCLITVGLRQMNEVPPLFVWWRSQAGEQAVPGIGPVPSYRTAITIGHLVIDVIGVLHPWAQLQVESDDRLVQVWPVESESLDWPPVLPFKGIVNDDLV